MCGPLRYDYGSVGCSSSVCILLRHSSPRAYLSLRLFVFESLLLLRAAAAAAVEPFALSTTSHSVLDRVVYLSLPTTSRQLEAVVARARWTTKGPCRVRRWFVRP